MSLADLNTGTLSVWIQSTGSLLFCLVFLFLWRQSGIVYFGLWSIAWAVESVAIVMGSEFLARGAAVWLVFYAFLEFLFAVLLVAAARAGFSGVIRNWRVSLMIASCFPVFLSVLCMYGARGRPETFHALHAVILGGLYVYNYSSIRGAGLGGRLFRFSLLCLAVAFFLRAGLFVYSIRPGIPSPWVRSLPYSMYLDFALNTVFASPALAMWIENQHDRIREIGSELDRLRREVAQRLDLDRLTGLLNQSALSKRMEDAGSFQGVAVVCDMDDFKEINDRYGHLAGDEILRNIGHLLRASIRPEDEAFRWGGDEFVVLFHNQNREVARTRMQEIATRLRAFRVRGHGMLPISFSWGTAESAGRPLREVLDEADRDMYASKRKRR
ncbi:MAG: GGDEF domain-containing protein [Acidobacteria bacterium]|nr:GGDEF domain-containing protein [Acidobacteriota bacterium]